ncbi:hypothetical protein [Achromobacter xylosoxidans]|uniref:t-SNARE coiled-coil homology domain-containing protein n=1 Tax=Alcaligenes xylosoxydans xylosoxydans TaxID=85698 RepID=A0A1R1JT92_ALCXX|nr:hypothetical protein [Achromobacter xylosoxidans]OMG85415.1 hypothetical protein BIZ92_27090 [Achromobacter xylosoxidans]
MTSALPDPERPDFIDRLQKAHEEEFRYEAFEQAKLRVPGNVESIERSMLTLEQTIEEIAGTVERAGVEMGERLNSIESASRDRLQDIAGHLRYIGFLLLGILLLLAYMVFR